MFTNLSKLSKVTFITILSLMLYSCANKAPINLSAEELYRKAQSEVNNANYSKSIQYYDKLEAAAVGTSLAQQAQLDKAYAYYKNGDNLLALATINRFLQLHPYSPAADYAMYLKGLVYFNDTSNILSVIFTPDLADRDPYASEQSFAAFEKLVNTFPNSKYAADAKERMRFLINALAKKDVKIARFYYERKAYVAAINRCKVALENYQGAQSLEEALYIMAQSYKKLDLTQSYQNAIDVLKHNFPNSQYLSLNGQLIPEKNSWWKFW